MSGDRLREALTFLSKYEKDPPEILYDQWAYDRLLSFVHRVASEALAADERGSGEGGYQWDCPNCGERITSWVLPPSIVAEAQP